MELEFEAMRKVKLGQEHRSADLMEGGKGIRWRKEYKKKELGASSTGKSVGSRLGSMSGTGCRMTP